MSCLVLSLIVQQRHRISMSFSPSSPPPPPPPAHRRHRLVDVGCLPRVVVLDLDYTIWPLYADCSRPSDTPRLFPEVGVLAGDGAVGAVRSASPVRIYESEEED